MHWDTMSPRRVSRRGLLIGAGAAGAAIMTAGAAAATAPRRRDGARWLAFESAWTGEKLKLTYYENGRYVEDALHALDRLMRDARDNTVVQMDPRLYDLLFDLNRLMDSANPFTLNITDPTYPGAGRYVRLGGVPKRTPCDGSTWMA